MKVVSNVPLKGKTSSSLHAANVDPAAGNFKRLLFVYVDSFGTNVSFYYHKIPCRLIQHLVNSIILWDVLSLRPPTHIHPHT